MGLRWGGLGVATAALLVVACGVDGPADSAPRDPETIRLAATVAGLAPLSTVHVPRPKGDIVDREAAIALGKALFWDMAVGSDGQTACATCHFSAGADARMANVVNPGPNGIYETEGIDGPGKTLLSLPRLLSDDRIGSPGVPAATLVEISAVGADECVPLDNPTFGTNRQVTSRNTPSVIGAVLYRNQFWDGRAESHFNGVDPFGLTANAGDGIGRTGRNASLASQSLGPPLNTEEMSCADRTFNGTSGVAGRLLTRPALEHQKVSPTDSALGPLSAWPDPGLRCGGEPCTYRELIARAFGPASASAAKKNFSRLFGLAVAAYEATLIPDDTPFDRWLEGDNSALTEQQLQGVDAFVGSGDCASCHAGPELSDASYTFFRENGPLSEDGNDVGYHNIGLRPTEEDLGRATIGPGGVSYSISGSTYDRGAFKTPGLRNVALTPPYFHNGGAPTLQAMMNFYDRGGDFENPERSSRIQMLGLQPEDFQGILDLLQNGLTDCRVANRRAPFDHPSIEIPGGPALEAVGAEGIGPCP